MEAKKGSLSISSENIFPIIKKWVYSDHDIFVREMISNGCDAITKLKKLDVMGEYQLPDDYKASIHVEVNPEEKTLKFIDNGLGMTAEEVEEYITQIAFSGATEFLEKYKDKTTEDDSIDKEKTFGELKFTAVRDVFLQNEDGTPSTQLKKRIYDLKCSLHGGIIPVSVPPEVPLREFPYNAVVELVNPVVWKSYEPGQ